MKTVIMAGGKGTRISSVASDIPKPMIKIEGKPVLEHEINCLRKYGFTDLIITVSHMAEQIISYFGDGSAFGVNIEYFIEEQPLGNAGALLCLKEKLTSDFLLINADSIFDIDLSRFVNYHLDRKALVTLFTHPNNHPYDSGVIVANKQGEVENWLTKEDDRPQWYRNRVNAGIHILNPEVLNLAKQNKENDNTPSKVDLDRDILKKLVGTGKMYCYDSPEYVKDMGTPDRYAMVCNDFRKGLVNEKNMAKKQRAVFLDRDGTINVYKGFLTEIEDFELIEGVEEAIGQINRSGYLAIVATNQPVIARGEVTFEQLEEIHAKMETLLGVKGAYLDGIYFCPHHPDKGFQGEVPELKFDCDCRKPKPGMLLQAAGKFNIDLENSWMVGDGESDIRAGKAAGCKTALIGTGEYGQDVTVSSLAEFVNKRILSDKE